MSEEQRSEPREPRPLTFSIRTLILIMMTCGVFFAGVRSGDKSVPGTALGLLLTAGFLYIWFTAAIFISVFWPAAGAGRNDSKR